MFSTVSYAIITGEETTPLFVKEVMNQRDYEYWLDVLDTAPAKEFFPTFRRFFNLLVQSNQQKVTSLEKIIQKEGHEVQIAADQAEEELRPLFAQIARTIRNKLHLALPPTMTEYLEYKAGKRKLLSGWLPGTLYHAIRRTLEGLYNEPRNTEPRIIAEHDQPHGLATLTAKVVSSEERLVTEYDHLMSEHNKLWYLDYDKVAPKYPKYAHFAQRKDEYLRGLKEEPWGDYANLNWSKDAFRDEDEKWAESFVREDIMNRLRRFILYILTPQVREETTPSRKIGIKGLFYLSEKPTSIFYDGTGRARRDWYDTEGKTQPYAILKLAVEKYERGSRKEGIAPTQVKLSLKEINDFLRDPQNCNRPPGWEARIPAKRRLDLLKKNIRQVVPFTDDELTIEGTKDTAFLVFHLK